MRVTRIEMQTTASKHDNDLQLVTAVPEVFDIDLAGALGLSGPQIIDRLAANRHSTGARLWPGLPVGDLCPQLPFDLARTEWPVFDVS